MLAKNSSSTSGTVGQASGILAYADPKLGPRLELACARLTLGLKAFVRSALRLRRVSSGVSVDLDDLELSDQRGDFRAGFLAEREVRGVRDGFAKRRIELRPLADVRFDPLVPVQRGHAIAVFDVNHTVHAA